jgi:hypothetical protein
MSQPDGARGIEQLVRDTLTDPRRRLDPPAGHHELVRAHIGQARRARTLRWVGATAAVVALLAVVGLLVEHPRGTAPGPAAVPSPSWSQTISRYAWRQLPAVGSGEPVQIVAADGWFYLLEQSPGAVLRLNRPNLAIAASAQVPDRVESLAVDPGADRLWAWYTGPDGITVAREFVASTLAQLRDVTVGGEHVFQGVGLDGALWLGTDKGLYRIGPSESAAALVPGVAAVYAIAIDPGRHRLLIDQPPAGASGSGPNIQVAALNPATLTLTMGAQLRLFKDEIVVVAGQVWVGGYGPVKDPRLYHLDPATLRVAGTSEVNDQLGPGAILWAGTGSLWVRDGGDEQLSCLDPATGAIRQQWQAELNSIASMPGTAIAVFQPNLVQLEVTDGCGG